MTAIVERLRAAADDASLDCYSLCEEAADRIEALEAALAGLLTAWDVLPPDIYTTDEMTAWVNSAEMKAAVTIARAALALE